MKIVWRYSVKNYIELLQPSSPALSQFDYEHIVLTDYALQPRSLHRASTETQFSLKPLNASTICKLVRID